MEAYLDNAATTRVFPEVREKMVRVMEEDFGNPSSKHTKGMDAEKYIRETKEILAKDLKCTPGEIIFTSGGTESNNTALIGGAYANRRAGKHIITTRIEHASVHEPLAFLEELGYQVTYLPVDKNGQVSPSELEKALTEETILVSIMFVNNEIGAVEDVKTLSEIVHSYNPKILFHVDAIQAYGKYHIVPKRLGIDVMSVSGHKRMDIRESDSFICATKRKFVRSFTAVVSKRDFVPVRKMFRGLPAWVWQQSCFAKTDQPMWNRCMPARNI